MLPLAAGPSASAPVPGTDVTYTLDADFDKGVLANVNHDAPNNNQLQLNEITETFPFIWVALSVRCTIAKINTETGAILGEYRTISDEAACHQSSRTTVALDGSVWVGHRGPGGVTHVGLSEVNQCIDRNNSGSIETSSGYGDVRPWPGSTSNVAQAADECIIHHVDTGAAGVAGDSRHMSIDKNNKLWVGSFTGGHTFVRINGNTGAIETMPRSFECGGYGGLIDSHGVIWSASQVQVGLLRWDPDAPDSPTNPRCIETAAYGLAIDGNGFIWTTELDVDRVWKVSPDGNTILGPFSRGSSSAQGLAVDAKGDVWVSSSLRCTANCTVGHLKNDGTFVGNVPNPTGAGSTGVSVDAAGRVWTANLNSHTATRIDPNAGPLGCGGTGCGSNTHVGAVDLTVNFPAGPNNRPLPFPYNYSDMTGAQLLGSTAPQGTWTVVQDGGAPGTVWGTVTWNTEPQGTVPPGASLTVDARAADTEAGLGGEPFVPVTNGMEFTRTGRFVQVRVTFKPNDEGESPVLSDIRIQNTPQLADLAIEKTDFPDPVHVGETLRYGIKVTNHGEADAKDVVVVDELPHSVTFMSATPSQGTCTLLFGGPLVVCHLGTIDANQTATIAIEVTPNAVGTIVNTADVDSSNPDPVLDNNTDSTETTVLRSGDFSCRASALRVGTIEPVVANPGSVPCRDDSSSPFAVSIPVGAIGVTAVGPSAVTDATPDDPSTTAPAAGDGGSAAASVAAVTIKVGLTTIKANLVQSSAEVECTAGPTGGLTPTLSSASSIAGLSVNGRSIAVGTNSMSIPLGIGTLHLNHVATTNNDVTRRAIWLQVGAYNIVVSESHADWTGTPSPCAGSRPIPIPF